MRFGGLGNRMFQYMFALALKARVPDAEISGVELPEWGISTPAAPAQTGARVRVVKHDVPFAKVARRLSSADTIDVDLYRLNLRFEYYRDQLELFRRTFPRREIEGAGRDEIAISIRGGEILTGQHQNFLPLPISLYERIVDSTGLRPVFAGQIGDDPYSSALRARFPNAHFVKHPSGLADFHFLRASHNIVVAISSYSWLASWLSESAERIHLPVAGLYHPAARPDCNLLPRGDNRYVFHQTDLLSWSGRREERSRLSAAPLSDFGYRPGIGSRAWLAMQAGPKRYLQSLARRHLLFLQGAADAPPADLAQRRAAKEADHV